MAEEALVEGSIFEGLFERRLKPSGAFADELRTAGYDVKAPKPQYPISLFERTIEIAARHAYPGKKLDEAAFLLGGELTHGYFKETLAGKVVSHALPMVGPERLVKGLPTRMKMGTTATPPTVEKIGERKWRVMLPTPLFPELVAGSIQASLQYTGVESQVVVEHRGTRPVLLVTWTAK